MTPMFEKFARMCDRGWLNGRAAKTTEVIPNDYAHDRAEIPAGTPLVCDFAGDFGMYAIADVNGVLRKVKIPLECLHQVTFDAEG